MANPVPAFTWRDLWQPIALAITVGGVLIAGGGYITQVKENTRRIDAVEQRVELLRSIDTRTARIEAKLEILAPAKGHRP